MPNVILEYSDNLELDIQPLFTRLHEALVATGAVNLKGLKSRAIRHSEYRLADGYHGYAFIHVNLLIREGRPLETQQEMTRRTMQVLEETFGHRFEDGYLSLSVDLKEMKVGLALTKHNFPVEGVSDDQA